jgi:hypothetical protein
LTINSEPRALNDGCFSEEEEEEDDDDEDDEDDDYDGWEETSAELFPMTLSYVTWLVSMHYLRLLKERPCAHQSIKLQPAAIAFGSLFFF